MMRADLFVLLDNVQFPKTGGTWVNRVKVLSSGSAAWETIPIVRSFQGVRRVSEIQTNGLTDWRSKLRKSMQANYGRAPFFGEVSGFLTDLIMNPDSSLCSYNVAAIRAVAEALGVDTGKLRNSSDIPSDGSGTELLILITRSLGGAAYLCGGGAGGYQEDERFAHAGVKLIYQDFRHPVYPQHRADVFVPGLSVIDALMNLGFSGTRELLIGPTSGPPE